MNIILLSGGSGKRLWPLSNEVRSKQFLKVLRNPAGHHESMIQRMYRMLKSIDIEANVVIATSDTQVTGIRSQLNDDVSISIEPERRDTFPAIALATAFMHEKSGLNSNDTVIVCPIDPYVEESYFETLIKLDNAAKTDSNLILMGIEPTYPSAKYGYIIPKDHEHISKVLSFKEKPTPDEAEVLIGSGALWNGGVFAYKLSYVLDIAEKEFGSSSYDYLYSHYSEFPCISFDYAVVEKEADISVIRYNGEWKDLGTWNTLTEAMEDEVAGTAKAISCENTHIINELRLPLIALGVRNLAIAATPDGILVTNKDSSGYLKDYVEDQRPMVEKRAWGDYEVLDYRGFEVESDDHSLTKHILVRAGKHISYQLHNHRTETWVIVKGDGEVILDGEVKPVHRGDTIVVPLGVKHAIRALTDLHIIEVQVGDELTEEDIERFEWDWTARDRYNHWIKAGMMTDELASMSDADIEEVFGSELHFGTGGIRAIMGAGTGCLNKYTVSRITGGAASYLNKHFEKPSVVIAYDTRHNSKEFALTAASIFAKNGVRALLFSEPVPTPLLSYAVWNLDCSAGIVITASHNSKEYNGYKVYDRNGCQITDKAAKEIQSEIEVIDIYAVGAKEHECGELIEAVSEDIYDDYIDSVQASSFVTEGDKDLRILYTPLNGTGLKFALRALKDSGFKNVNVISEQAIPDGDFPTCPYPNPELTEVMEYCVPYANEMDADIIIATDPDCDRIGVMCRDNQGEFIRLNPNEVGVLMLDFICQRMKSGKDTRNSYTPVFMKTVVTTSMAEKVAERYGLKAINTLTGFKYIGEQIECLKAGEEFIFGMEESCGYLSNSQIRDKDGVNAALLISAVAQECKDRGINLYDRMKELYEEYGYYLNSQKSYKFDGPDGADRMKAIMDKIHMPLPECDGLTVVDGIDYSEGYRGLPPTNMKEYKFSDGSRFLIRPSGTEPKLKVYIEAIGANIDESREKEIRIARYVERIAINSQEIELKEI